MEDFRQKRINMINSQLEVNGISDECVLSVMGSVKRESFINSSKHHVAYSDCEIAVELGGVVRTMLRPLVFASMLQAVKLDKKDFVLDIACAGGYSTAVLAGIVSSVIGLECDDEMVKFASTNLEEFGNAAAVKGSLNLGLESEGLFDVIFIQGGVEEVPNELFAQLKDGGRLVYVDYSSAVGKVVVCNKVDGLVGRSFVRNANASLIEEFMRQEEFVL